MVQHQLQTHLAVMEQTWSTGRAHHGVVPSRGTDSGFLDLLNQLKKAQEWGVSALLCSWDVKRAFDSVSRTVIHMTLSRLGSRPILSI